MNASRRQLAVIGLTALVLAAISATAGFSLAQRRALAHPARVTPDGREPLYWYDPMKPDQHFDKPGQSPYMDMQLVPMYADQGATRQTPVLAIDPTIVQNLGVRFTRVERGLLAQTTEAIGTVEFDQRNIAIIQARSNGFVTRVYARAPGDVITQSAPIVDLLVPEWAGAQTEFLALLKSGDTDLIEAARQRLVLLGMPVELIGRIQSTGELHTTITVRSPIAGMIDTLEARAGMTVPTGATLAKINGLATVWIEAALPEARSALARLGERVEARLTAYPDQRFTGRVIGVLPQADSETRTVRVRIALDNRNAQLRPGMYAQVQLDQSQQTSVLYVASEAVIRTGKRALVIVADDQNHFLPTEIQPGADVDGKTVILTGLTEGQTIVASGQFLIDSEANLKGLLRRLASDHLEHDEGATEPGCQP
jgi:membrane fusion protein, copper/silver efflux system